MIDYRVTEFDTDTADPGDRADRWIEHTRAEQGAMEFHFDKGPGFRARSVIQTYREHKLAEFGSRRMRYHRRDRDARRDKASGSWVVIPRSGRVILSQGRDTVTLTPGTLGAMSMQWSMSLVNDNDTRAFLFTVPHGVLSRQLDRAAPLRMDSRNPLVAMLAGQLEIMHEHRATMTAYQFVSATEHAFHLLESALHEKAAKHVGDMALIAEKALWFIASFSDDRRLTPRTLADELGWSMRQVANALRMIYDTSPGALLRVTRMQRAYDRLADPSYGSIEKVWFDSGFGSASAFRAAFGQHYNMSPSQMREALVSGADPAQTSPASDTEYPRIPRRHTQRSRLLNRPATHGEPQ